MLAAATAAVTLAACSDGTAPPQRREATTARAASREGMILGALRPLRVTVVTASAALAGPQGATVPTYDGSGQVVHPDVVVFPEPWHGHRFWMAITPYPGGNASFENPTLLASDDGVAWRLPEGAPNPTVGPPTTGYLSDPDLVYRADRDELWLYYRHSGVGEDEIWLTRTGDGVSWSQPTVVFHRRSYGHVSPSVAPTGRGGWRAWFVDAGAVGCRATRTVVRELRSSDGVRWHPRRRARSAGTTPVTEASPVRLEQPGHTIWHLDVQYVPAWGEYWALYAAYPAAAGGCAPTGVFFARSRDGVRWTTYPTPLLAREEAPLFRDLVYRSTFAYDSASRTLTVWYSGATLNPGSDGDTTPRYAWSAAVATYAIDDVLAHVAQPTAAAAVGEIATSRAARALRWRPATAARPGVRAEEMP
ncbi:MAG: hypothetical protein ACJ79S_03660 [Gemmatimonadaceae bacterium]